MTNLVYGKTFFRMKEVEKESVDLVYADPPFGISRDILYGNALIGYEPKKGDWDLVEESYLEYLAYQLVMDAKRTLKSTGNIFIQGVYGSLIRYWNHLIAHGFHFRHHIIWHKTNPAPSINRRSLTYSNEMILWFSRKNTKWYFDYDLSKYFNGGKQLHDTWDIAAVRKQAGVTRKPPKLMERIVRIFSPKGGLVIDPVCGSGTTLELARDHDRNFIGYEIRKECIDYLKGNNFNVIT